MKNFFNILGYIILIISIPIFIFFYIFYFDLVIKIIAIITIMLMIFINQKLRKKKKQLLGINIIVSLIIFLIFMIIFYFSYVKLHSYIFKQQIEYIANENSIITKENLKSYHMKYSLGKFAIDSLTKGGGHNCKIKFKNKNQEENCKCAADVILYKNRKYYFNQKKGKEITSSKDKYQPIEYKKYKYKVKYNERSGNIISTIYLFDDNKIKIVNEIQEVVLMSGCNCYRFTGKTIYEEKEYNYSKRALKIIKKIFKELEIYSGKKVIDTSLLELTNEQENVLDGICNNDEDGILIIDMLNHLEYDNYVNNVKNNKGDILFQNKIKTLKKDYSNDVLNRISLYINNKIEKELKEINKDFSTRNKDETMEGLGVNYQVDLININRFNIVFQLTIEGQLGATSIYDVKYYQFNYAGTIDDKIYYSDYYINKVIKNFKNQELYLNYKDILVDNWEKILEENIFKTGNWYTDEENINFIIDSSLLGLDGAAPKIINIKIEEN